MSGRRASPLRQLIEESNNNPPPAPTVPLTYMETYATKSPNAEKVGKSHKAVLVQFKELGTLIEKGTTDQQKQYKAIKEDLDAIGKETLASTEEARGKTVTRLDLLNSNITILVVDLKKKKQQADDEAREKAAALQLAKQAADDLEREQHAAAMAKRDAEAQQKAIDQRRQEEAHAREEANRRAKEILDNVECAIEQLGELGTGIADLRQQLTDVEARLVAPSRSVKNEFAVQRQKIDSTLNKELGSPRYKVLKPAGSDFASIRAALDDLRKPDRAFEQQPNVAADLKSLLTRLEVLAKMQRDGEEFAGNNDPALRQARAARGAVRGWIWTPDLAVAQVGTTLRDIVGIIGNERAGRSSPTGRSSHIHVAGNAQDNVLFHDSGNGVRVLGFVDGHMDRRAPPSVLGSADTVEGRAASGNAGFTEVEVDLVARSMRVV